MNHRPKPERRSKAKNQRTRFSLRVLFVYTTAIAVCLALIAMQQKRQQEYVGVVEFMISSFDSGGPIPTALSDLAGPKHTHTERKGWVSSVDRPPNNGPAFISSEHELIYRPSSNGLRLADLTVVSSWHFLHSKPTIRIRTGGGQFDDAVVQWLREKIDTRLTLSPILDDDAR